MIGDNVRGQKQITFKSETATGIEYKTHQINMKN